MDEFYIPTYEEYKLSKVKYSPDQTCGVMDCKEPGLYEGGDARCWFPMCEKHARIREQYESHAHYIRRRKRIRKLWASGC